MPDLPLMVWMVMVWLVAVFGLVIAGWRWHQAFTEEEQA